MSFVLGFMINRNLVITILPSFGVKDGGKDKGRDSGRGGTGRINNYQFPG